MRPADAELRAAVARQDWFHTIDLGSGVVTPGRDESPRKLGWIGLPSGPGTGRSVLDVGAWDWLFSFECERRGAARVLAVDGPAWQEPAWGPRGYGTKAGFELARRALDSRGRGPHARAGGDLAVDGGALRRRPLPRRAVPPQAPVGGAGARGERVRRAADRRDPRRPAGPAPPRDGALPGRRGRGRRLELVGAERARAGGDAARGGLRARRERLRARRSPTGSRALPTAASAARASALSRAASWFTPTGRDRRAS